MFRIKTRFIYKTNIKHIIFPIHLNKNALLSTRENNFFGNLETTNFFKPFLLYNKFPKFKINEKYMSGVSEPVCWNCKKTLKLKNFTCASCGVLQPPKPDLSFFELLGISQTFEINVEEMTKKFRNLQMIFHPDKVSSKSEQEKLISETYSRLLNEAYKTLKDPVSRGFYLLEFNKASSKISHPLDPKFLSAIMEKNEELETIDNLSALKKFVKDNNEQIEKQITAVQQAFRNNKLLEANNNLLKLNYFINLDQKIKEKEAKFKPSDDD